jgi:hypothetical protein
MLEHARRLWIEGGARFMFFVTRVDGRHIMWEFRDPDGLRPYLQRTLVEFESRHSACEIEPLVVEPLRTQIAEVCYEHTLNVGRSDPRAKNPARGLQVQTIMHGGSGRIVLLTVDRTLVESRTVFGVLRFLDSLVATRDEIEQNWLSLRVAFDGFDSDSREVFEIPEVRAFIGTLAAAAPWWICILSGTEHIVWLAALAKLQSVQHFPGGRFRVHFEPGQLEAAMKTALTEVGPLLRCAGFEEDDTFDTLLQNMALSLGRLAGGTSPAFDDPFSRQVARLVEKTNIDGWTSLLAGQPSVGEDRQAALPRHNRFNMVRFAWPPTTW